MPLLKLLINEIGYRKLNFMLSAIGVSAAVALFVCGTILIDGYASQTRAELARMQDETDARLAAMEDETRKLMLRLGFNLLIVPRDTNMADFWSNDFAALDMPQEYVDRLAQAEALTLVTHLVATLQARYDFDGRKVLLVGYLPETPKAHEAAKKPMGLVIEPGTAVLGHELAQGRQVGEAIELGGRSFRIARILPEAGSKEDISIAVHLADAQDLLGKPGRVNQILAIGCQCEGERLPKIRAQLAQVLPETRITEFSSIAVARAEQRDLVAAERAQIIGDIEARRHARLDQLERLAGIVTPLVVLAAGLWVGVLMMANVRERRTELGLLRALGKGAATIASLVLGKAVLLGCVGAAAGLAAGIGLAYELLDRGMQIGPEHFHPAAAALWTAALGAPLLCLLASYLPTIAAITQSPATVLRDE